MKKLDRGSGYDRILMVSIKKQSYKFVGIQRLSKKKVNIVLTGFMGTGKSRIGIVSF